MRSSTSFTLGTLFLALPLAAPPAPAQGQWTQLNPAVHPAIRDDHAMVEYGARGVLLFGGEATNSGQKYDDTWVWNGDNWIRQQPSGLLPFARSGHDLAYDPARDRVVLFSGWDGGSYTTDTFEFDGQNWNYIFASPSPGGRDWSALTYDPNTATTILFGGHDWQRSVGGLGPYGDMWSWDGSSWTLLSPATSPPARMAHAMAYDKNSGKVLLFGGANPADMWSWDGVNWTQLTPAHLPPARNWPAMAYDDSRRRMVLFGGKDAASGNVLDDVWEWDGNDWTQVTTSGGPALAWVPAAYDAVQMRVLINGGSTAPDRSAADDKTWAYAGPGAWTNLFNDLPGQLGSPLLTPEGILTRGSAVSLQLSNAQPNSISILISGTTAINIPVLGGTLVPSFDVVIGGIPTGTAGGWNLGTTYPAGLAAGVPLYFQIWLLDPSGPQGVTASNAVMARTQ